MSHPISSRASGGFSAISSRPDPISVLHAAIDRSSLGFKGAAGAIGRSPGILYNKFSESMPHYDVTVREAVALCRAIDDSSFVDALCAEFDGIFLPVPVGSAADDDVLASSLEMMRQMGDLARELAEARADGLIDVQEFAALELRGLRMIRAVYTLLQDLRSQVREVPESPVSLIRR